MESWLCNKCEQEAVFEYSFKAGEKRSLCCGDVAIRQVYPVVDICEYCHERADFWEDQDGEILSSCCSAMAVR